MVAAAAATEAVAIAQQYPGPSHPRRFDAMRSRYPLDISMSDRSGFDVGIDGFRCAQPILLNPRRRHGTSVGWVERSDTHHLPSIPLSLEGVAGWIAVRPTGANIKKSLSGCARCRRLSGLAALLLLGGARPEPAGDRLLGRGEWWLAGDARPWQPDAVSVLSDKLVFRPRVTPVAGCDLWHRVMGPPGDLWEPISGRIGHLTTPARLERTGIVRIQPGEGSGKSPKLVETIRDTIFRKPSTASRCRFPAT